MICRYVAPVAKPSPKRILQGTPGILGRTLRYCSRKPAYTNLKLDTTFKGGETLRGPFSGGEGLRL